jgi:hypothetical protein
MKPDHSTKEVEDWDFRALWEYLDLLFHIFDNAEAARLLHILMHLNNLRPATRSGPTISRPGGGCMLRVSAF